MMFFAPKVNPATLLIIIMQIPTTSDASALGFQNPTMFEKWKRVLAGTREFRAADRICQHHFDPKDIDTHWEHLIKGEVHSIERIKPRLQPYAVPSLLLESLKTAAPRKPRALKGDPKMMKKSTKHDDPLEVIELDVDSSTPALRKLQPIKRKRKLEPKDDLYPVSLELHIEATEGNDDQELSNEPSELPAIHSETNESDDDEETAAKKRSIFNTLYEDVFEVELPCTRYGIHRDPERTYIAFSLFDPVTMNTAKALHFDERLRTRIVRNGVVVSRDRHKDLTVDTLSEMLADLDSSNGVEKDSPKAKRSKRVSDDEDVVRDCS